MAKAEKFEVLKDYSIISDLGEGNFGKVKLSILNSNNEKYAIKIIDKKKLNSQKKSSAFNEIEIISRLNHPNIIYVEKILEDEKNFYIIMEYCNNGELFNYIVDKEKLEFDEALSFFYQLINGVEYLHEQGFAHRDLKPENLLLNKNNILKIIDFGLCHDFNGTKLLKTKCGSPSYAAPEILLGYPYDGFKTDIWCCGIILYVMLCGFLPFDGETNQEIFNQIIECKPEYPSFLGEECISLLIGILTPIPEERLSIQEIKNHSLYLKGKNCFLIQFDDKFIINKGNEYVNFNSNNKRVRCTSVRKTNKNNINLFNNIKSLKKEKNFKNYKNIYENIFNDVKYDDESSNDKQIQPLLNKYILNNNEFSEKSSDKYDKAKKRKINEIAGLSKNMKKGKIRAQTEGNKDKPNFSIGIFKNKLKGKKLKINSNIFYNNKDLINNKLCVYKDHSSSKSKNQNLNKPDKNNIFSLDIKLLNPSNSENEKKDTKIVISKLPNDKNINSINDKISNNNSESNKIKELRLQKHKFDFFQKFLMNNNKNQEKNKSPFKAEGLNFNVILTKFKGMNKNEKNIGNEDYINDKEKYRFLSVKKNKIFIDENIIHTQKRKMADSAKKRIVLSSDIDLVNSPYSNNNNYCRNKYNKYLDSIYGTNSIFKGKITQSICRNKLKFRYYSCSEGKKNYEKNMKINSNKKINLKITNLNKKISLRKNFIKNVPSNQKEDKSQEAKINSKNNIFSTEPKYNLFLDKVIQKINSNKKNKNKNINILTFNNKYKKNDYNQNLLKTKEINTFKEKENLEGQHLIINDKTNKKLPMYLKNDDKFLISKNAKIFGINSVSKKDKLKNLFQNFTAYNKKK